MRNYHIFISHSWSYSDAYEKLKNLLDKTGLTYSDYSVPKDDPIHNAPNEKALKNAIQKQIAPCSCVIILAGVYSTYSAWIDNEITIAKQMGKPIIAIEPWGSEKTSTTVKNNADIIIKWQSSSLKDAIIKYSK